MADHPAPSDVQEDHRRILEKCDYLVDVQLWPRRDTLDPVRWLKNFKPDEIDHATHLLDVFLYFSEPMVNALMVGAFQNLSRLVKGAQPSLITTQMRWLTFFDTLLITYVTGEKPNVTDSGFTFARKARQVLGIPEDRIVDPGTALQAALNAARPIVFVDDFVGSGSQMISTWQRQYPAYAGVSRSFSDAAQLGRSTFYYCPLVCTSLGMRNIKMHCRELQIEPAHLIASAYSLTSARSSQWPAHLRPTATDFIRRASLRAGIPDTKGRAVNDWQGFRKLGLALAFYHSVPDATIPLFYWQENGWQPLVRRT